MTVQVQRRGAVTTIVLDRPQAMNAVNAELGAELLQAVQAARADDERRAVVLTGNGKAFCSGADLKAGLRRRRGRLPGRRQRCCRSASTRSSRASGRCPSP